MIGEHLNFIESNDPLLIQFEITDNANSDSWKHIFIVLNGDKTAKNINLPEGTWTLVANGELVNEKGIETVKNAINVAPISALILYK